MLSRSSSSAARETQRQREEKGEKLTMIAYRTGVFGAVSGQCAARYIRERRDVERFWREGEQERESESESESDREREEEVVAVVEEEGGGGG